jgi:hypothetical protein
LLLTLPVLLVGCAKFPTGIDQPEFTRVTIRMRVAGNINTTFDETPASAYIYNIAIRATEDSNPPDNLAPVPVVNPNSPNGRMAGSPTHFVEFDSQNPNSAEPFVLYRFATRQEVPDPNDPDNPINLTFFTRSTRGRIVNYQNLSDNPSELRFDIFVNMLADTDEEARRLQTLQINFLTMNRLATGVGGTRVIDSIGDNRIPSEFNRYILVDLRRDGVIDNRTGPSAGIEPSNDTWPGGLLDPDLDIIDWSIEVQRRG